MKTPSVANSLKIQTNLARQRTFLANERTLLAHLRTGFAALVLGIALLQVFQTSALIIAGWTSSLMGIGFIILGVLKFYSRNKKISEM